VAPPTLNPPQSHRTNCVPQRGIVEIRLVITVAPQNDICPHGKTYPRKAVAITKIKIEVPDNQVFSKKNLRKKSPRPTCRNITKKNNEAPFKCKIRKTKPKKTSRPM
jgi:hypothetical protein